MSESELVPIKLRRLVAYFLRLGTFGFGGPIALAGYMQRDLVERKRWITKEDYVRGLALAQLAPGPLAAQLAIYLGWVRGKIVGATLVAIAFILPSFVMVLGLAAAYVELGGLPWMQGVFYGIGAAVIAIIWVFVASGLVVYLWRIRPFLGGAAASLAPWWFTGLHEPATSTTLWKILIYFAEAGAFVFGSGLA